MLRAEFHPDASDELLLAREWYRVRSLRVAEAFDDEFARSLAWLAEYAATAPRWPSHRPGDTIRVWPLRRFPFRLVFRVDEARLTVLAVAHTRRKPGYWRRRG